MKCDLCETDCTNDFFDFRLAKWGYWANGCPDCWNAYGIRKLGIGFGQHYVNGEKVNWVEKPVDTFPASK